MDASIIAALAAIFGALVGGISSFAGIWLAQRLESRRQLRRELFASATTLWQYRIKYAAQTGEPVLPLEDFIIDFLFFEDCIDRLGSVSNDRLIEILAKRDARFEAVMKYRFDKLKRPKH